MNSGRSVRGPAWPVSAGVALALLGFAGPALALPPVPQGVPVEHDPQRTYAANPVSVAPPNLDAALADETPIEGPLKGLAFLSETDAVLSPAAVGAGVDAHRVALIDDPAFVARMQSFLGQPVSLKVVAEIEAEVANWARQKGMPFVSVSTPEQEITGGVLQFRVLEFHVGTRQADAGMRLSDTAALAGVRVQPGDRIDAVMLAEDLNWLSRSPFREVRAEFTPGEALGATDLKLRIEEQKPWLVTAGLDNSGARATGANRMRASLILGDLAVPGSVLTYQLATSLDAFDAGLYPFGGHAAYQSHTLGAEVPTLPRQMIEATFDALESNSTAAPFDLRSNIIEGGLGYRLAASELGLPPGWGDVFGGVEMRRAELESRFGGVVVTDNGIEVVQFRAGWSNTLSDDNGATDLAVELHLSPGGLGTDNSDAAFTTYSGGRVTTARYAYANFDIGRTTRFGEDVVLENAVTAQLASGPLVDTEQMTLGGISAVRGFLPDDGAFDAGVYVRNTLSFGFNAFGSGNTVAPFALADFGVGHNLATGVATGFASAGGGVDLALAGHVTGTLTGAVALTDASITRRGDVSLIFRIGGQY